MRRILMALGAVGLLFGGVAGAEEFYNGTVQPGETHIVRQERGFFNALRMKKDLRPLCGDMQPASVEVFHTVGDGFAAVLTGILYTPAHLRVTCPAPTALR